MFATLVTNAGFAGFLFLLALLLQGPLGYDALGSGLRYVPLMAGFVLVAPLVSRFEPQLGPRLLLGAGFALFAAGTLMLTRLTAADDWAVLIPGMIVAGIGCAIAQMETILGALASVPPSRRTMASGASAAFRQVGSSIGVALFGSILTNHYGGALPGSLAAARVPSRLAGDLLRGARVRVNSAGRLLPGMPATVARKVQQATHHAFVGAFNDTARFTALLLAGTLVIAVAIARRPQRAPAHVPDPPPVVDLEQPVSVG